MFYLLDKANKQIVSHCNKPFYQEGFETIDENNSTDEEKVYINEYKKKNEVSLIKTEYNEKILAKYPYHVQINMQADITEIHLLARQEDRVFTEAEMQKVGEAAEMKNWIFSMREECNNKIAAL